MHLNLVPKILFGEGSYALSAVKQIETTDAFLNLHEDIKNCQNIDTYEACKAREYIEQGLDSCHCTPYEIRNYSMMVNIN